MGSIDLIDASFVAIAIIIAASTFAVSRLSDTTINSSSWAANAVSTLCKLHYARVSVLFSSALVIGTAIAVSLSYAFLQTESTTGLSAKSTSRYEFERAVAGLQAANAEYESVIAALKANAIANVDKVAINQLAACENFRVEQIRIELKVAELRMSMIDQQHSGFDSESLDKIKRSLDDSEQRRRQISSLCKQLGRPALVTGNLTDLPVTQKN